MIVLNAEHKFDFSNEFKNVTSKFDKFIGVLITLKKPFINFIAKDLKSGKISLFHSADATDPRILVLNEKGTKVSINVSNLAKDLDKALAKNTIDISELYAYLIQAFGLVNWNLMRNNRELIATALDTYGDMMSAALTVKGLGFFKNDQDKNKMKFLLYTYVLYKSDTAVSDHIEYAHRVSEIKDETAIHMHEKYKDYLEKPGSFNDYFVNVLSEEYKFLKKVDSVKYIIHNVFRSYSPTAAMFIDDLSYFVPLSLDFVQTSTPTLYKSYGGLNTLIKKSSYQIIFNTLSEKL